MIYDTGRFSAYDNSQGYRMRAKYREWASMLVRMSEHGDTIHIRLRNG